MLERDAKHKLKVLSVAFAFLLCVSGVCWHDGSLQYYNTSSETDVHGKFFEFVGGLNI